MLKLLTAGESHGPALTAILQGLPAGLPLTPQVIDEQLARRQRGYGAGGRMKLEHDRVQILSGVMAGQTTGAPIALLVLNADHEKWKGKAIEPLVTPRPGHADLTGALKYGYRDLRPALERASARETTMRVAAGAICRHFLAHMDISLGGYVAAIGPVSASLADLPYPQRFALAEENDLRCPDPQAAALMRQEIEKTIHAKNTLGGLIEVFALNVPAGLGSFIQWDERLDARLAQALLSVQAIKGVEIGEAFQNALRPGTQAQDAIAADLSRPTNRAGGIEGGISNGQPILARAAMKPIATTLTPQQTVNLASGQPAPTRYERSDFCPVPRAVPILEAMLAFTLASALLQKLGGDSLTEIAPRLRALRSQGIPGMDNAPHIFWE